MGKQYKSSAITRQAICIALKQLMDQKPLEKITISELMDTCGMRRQHFYYYFTDIYDLLRWMLGGEVEEVTAMTARLNHDYIEAEDLGMALLRFRNGALGMVEGTVNTYGNSLEETLYIFGSNGTVKLGGKAANKVEFWSIAGDTRTAEDLADALPDTIYGLGHTSLYTDVIDAIKTGRAPYVTARDGMEALELVLAIYKSAAEGRPVKLPLEDCSTLDFAGRFGLTD